MSKLKIYCIGNIDGRLSTAVAATSQAEAARAIGCTTGFLAREGCCITDPHMAGDCCPLIMATPGIPWERGFHYGWPPEPPWRCRDELAGAKAIVRVRFPEETIEIGPDYAGYRVRIVGSDIELGRGETESAAWIEAARILSIEVPGLPDNAITVWRWADAPEPFREFEPDDVDWIAFVPSRFRDDYVGWLDRLGPSIERYPVRDGEVWIGTH